MRLNCCCHIFLQIGRRYAAQLTLASYLLQIGRRYAAQLNLSLYSLSSYSFILKALHHSFAFHYLLKGKVK